VGLVPPNEFIPALEETGLIVRVGSWVITTVCEQIGRWTRGPVGAVNVSVNVSDRQFIEGDLESIVTGAILKNGIAPEQLELELTEGSMITNTERTIACLQSLKAQGVQISIDDFGTGYSSLAYLRRFPIDKLKIDITFIRDITSNPDAAAIVRAIMQMAHSLKLRVVAEGVETEAQLAALRKLGCDYMQGFFYSRPLTGPELDQLVCEDRRLPPPRGDMSSPLKTLLLVDDEEHILSALKRALYLEGYQILMAQSAAEGFELLALHDVHVILCDQRMPGMSGTEFLDRVKDLHPDTLRIVLSGYTELESILQAINCGAIYRFYTKPWEDRALRDNIREAFRHHGLLRAHALAGQPESAAGSVTHVL
jgi:EAL domain-containing protein (putative c-di-GMP-specific phosphodiesterase class I)/CheY-like chemotaxis protein